ncbi:MAG TPA: hypothetical protein VMT69_01320, partial [Kineosporiaceae bacterium]|nr:hypothetical protein [Kineosporiaceae bacterium]
LATVLAAAGVGRVRLVEQRPVRAADVGPGGAGVEDVGARAATAASRAAARLRPGGEDGSDDGRSPSPAGRSARPADLVVLVRAAVADSASAAALLAAGVPHLSVVVRERGLVVGPLVVPGRGACLRCLDLHRADRDPAWPRVLAQLTGRASPTANEEAASAVLAASLAALQVLCHLDGRARAATVSATLEVGLPNGLASRRPWPPHPSCGCGRVAPTGHRERSGATAGRMGA